MADTKISALPAVATPAGAIQFGVNNAGVSDSLTLAQVMAFVNTAPIWAAGTASAGTWPKFTSGTLLTTPVAGTWEYDGNGLYFTTALGRGIVASEAWCIQATTHVLTSTTAAQAIFNASANGAITLPAGLYEIEMSIVIESLSATSGGANLLIGGTVNATFITYNILGARGVTTIALNSGAIASAFGTLPLLPTSTATSASVFIKAILKVTTAGTFIPQLALGIAAAAHVDQGSYCKVKLLGVNTVATIGNWS